MSPVDDVPLATYVELLADLPLPTKQQKEAFADYVAHAHSWYKHLSPYPPGAEFHFFIDRHAGRERRHGTAEVRDRTERGFHYSEIPTAVYREAFGYLAYWRGSRNTVPFVIPRAAEKGVVAPDPIASMSDSSTLTYGLPPEIFEAGASRLSGAIHILSAANTWVWDESRRPAHVDWPQESGGPAILDGIFKRCDEIRESGRRWKETQRKWPRKPYPSADDHAEFGDAVLDDLLAPERKRQLAAIVDAIDRVCGVIEAHRS